MGRALLTTSIRMNNSDGENTPLDGMRFGMFSGDVASCRISYQSVGSMCDSLVLKFLRTVLARNVSESLRPSSMNGEHL